MDNEEAPLFRRNVSQSSAVPAVDDSIEGRFKVFDAANPHVWKLFEEFTLEAVRRLAGHERVRIGARLVWERMRWEVFFETYDQEFKLNDHYIKHMALKFIARYPEHAETEDKPCLFEFRNRSKTP